MPHATVTSKGQVTIPKPVRDHLKVEAGDRVSFVVQPDGTVVVRPIVRDVRELAGVLHRPGAAAVSVESMRRGVAARMRAKYGRPRP
jgi:antitoxin PrlF